MAAGFGILTLVAERSPAADNYSDRDWNTSFFANCRLPSDLQETDRSPSVETIRIAGDNKLRFVLNPNDMGGCRSDSKRRDGAPYWERAELRQSENLIVGEKYSIDFTANFDEGFTGQRETFFQIHGWSKTCDAAPMMMMQFGWRNMKIKVQKPSANDDSPNARGRQALMIASGPAISKLRGTEHKFRIALDLTDPATVAVAMDGVPIMAQTPVHFPACAEPHLKIGIYRPGKINPATSVVTYDDIVVDRLQDPNSLSN